MKQFKFYISFICMVLVLLPLQAQKINFEKGNEFSDKMLAPNAKQLAPTLVKQQGSLLRSLRADGQPVNLDLGDGLHLLPDDLDSESTVVSATITSDQWANLPAIWGDLLVSISNRIYEKFNDDFDFLFFVLDRINWDYADSLGFYGINTMVSNDVTGLGLNTYSNASAWGSGGKLKSAMFLPSTQMITYGPFLHELCHNWGAYICSINASGSPSYDFGGHWGVSNAGGQLGGFKYVRVVEENSGGVLGKTLYQASMYPDVNPDGSFIKPWDGYGGNTIANGGNSVPYSDIELYLMGMKSAQELRDANFHLDIYSGIDYDLDGNFSSDKGYFYSTAKTSYTIDDIIALNGERIPDAAASQKQFKALTVVITEEDSIPRFAYDAIGNLQWFSGYQGCDPLLSLSLYNFSEATNGIGSLITTDVKNSLKSNVDANVTGVSLDTTTISLPVNKSQRLTATILPSNARNKNVHWSSSDESVATVSLTGLITAVSEGETTITVTTDDGGFSATCTVTVTPALADFEVVDGVLVGYHGIGGDIVIPDNLGITKIGSYAFEINPTITSVSIPEGVTQILDYAFIDCVKLTSIVISNSVETIGDGAFANCSMLTSITIPKSVTSIGSNDVFLACNWLTSIQVDAENPAYSSKDGVLYNKDKTTLYIYPVGKDDVTFDIPNTVILIGDNAFFDTRKKELQKLTSITIPTSVETIGYRAFGERQKLTSITIPNSVKSIGDYAFGGCAELTSIMIPNSVEIIGNGAFSGCMKLASIDVDAGNPVYSSEDGILYNKGKTVLYQYSPAKDGTAFDIPNTVKTIEDNAFEGCFNLTSIIIPNTVTKIGMLAFNGCNITSISIPNSVTEIGQSAFQYCYELRDIAVHWKTPLTIYEYTLGLFNLYAITLHVPYGTKALYASADVWKEFGAIVEEDPLPATGVSLDKTDLSLFVGNTAQLTATILPEDAANSNLSWSSDNPGVATVSDNGLVTAQAAGTATITVTTQDGGLTDTCKVTVLTSNIEVTADEPAGTTGEGSINLALEIPTNTLFTGSFYIQLPDGFKLNMEKTRLTDALASLLDWSITPVEGNKYLITIFMKTRSSLRSMTDVAYTQIMEIIYNVESTVQNGSYESVISDLSFEFEDGTVIAEPEIPVEIPVDHSYTGVKKIQSGVNVYPNPTKSEIFIKSDLKINRVEIYSLTGALLLMENNFNGKIVVSTLPKGVYMLKIYTDNGLVMKKVMKE